MKPRIYLDTSTLNRPFDDQKQPRIWLETLASSVLLQMVEADQLSLISSTVIEFETERSPFPERQAWVWRVLKLATERVRVDQTIRQRAQILESDGIKALDALHIACAEAAHVNFFVTCDDRLIRQYQRQQVQVVTCLDPVSFVRRFSGQQKDEYQ